MKIIHSTLILVFMLIAVNFTFAQKKETRNVGSFTAISASSGLNVFLKKGSTTSVVVEADEKKIDKVRTEVKNGTLNLDIESKSWSWGSGDKEINVYVTYTSLNAIAVSGGVDIESEGILSSDKLSIAASGGADMELQIKVKDLKIDISGGADLDLSGTADKVNISASGGSDISAYGLTCQDANVNASGGADVDITVERSLNANASGAADVSYKGKVKDVKSNKSGGADIMRM
jgi:hypothetical protein